MAGERHAMCESALRRRSAAASLLRSWVRIPRGHGCLSVVSVVCCQVGGLCNVLITHPEESYRLWCVVVCDLQTSRLRRPWHALGRSATKKKSLCIYSTIPRGTLVGKQWTVHLKNRLWITKDRQMQSKNQRRLDRRNFNKTVNDSCVWQLTGWLPMTINCNQMNCGDVSLGILAAILNAQYKVRLRP
jgi:hypothetical protein